MPLPAAARARRVDDASSLRAEIERRVGSVPTFFEPAFANLDVARGLWHQAQIGWLDSPIPRSLRHALLATLARHDPWPWRLIAEEFAVDIDTAELPDPEPLLKLPTETVAASLGDEPLDDWPARGTAQFDGLLALILRLILDGPDEAVRMRLQSLVGPVAYASLIMVLTCLESYRMFAQADPVLAVRMSSRYRRAGDPLALAVVEIDESGAIASLSPAAEQLFGWHAGEAIGRVAAELFSTAGAEALRTSLNEVRAGDPSRLRERSFAAEAKRQNGGEFQAEITLANRRRNGDPGGVTAIIDVPGRHVTSGGPGGYAALLALAESGGGPLPARAVLEAMARTLGWQLGLSWRFDAAHEVLRCTGAWALNGGALESVEDRPAQTFARGDGLPGQVLDRASPVWIEDITPEVCGDDDPSLAMLGITSGLWLPIGDQDGEPLGVLELLSTRRIPADTTALEVLSGLAREATTLLELAEAGESRTPRPDAMPTGGLAFEGAPIATALVSLADPDAPKITVANPAMKALTGHDLFELEGKSIDDLTDPDDVAIDADLMAQLLAGKIPSYVVSKRFRRADGELFWGELSVALIRAQSTRVPLYLVVQLADVNERKRLEDSLEASRERVVGAFHEAPIGMAICTLDGHWLQVNSAFCEVFGYDEADLLGLELADVIDAEDLGMVERYLEHLLVGEVIGYHVETRALRSDGEVIWIQLSVSLVHDYDDRPAYILAEVQDVTERKRLEDELEQGTLRDGVTGLASRALLFDRLEQARARFVRDGAPFAVMFCVVTGLDDVLRIFDRDRADAALKEVAARLQAAVRAGDTVSRYGEDEFVVVCEALADNAEADVITRRLRELTEIVVGEGATTVHLQLTLGITIAASSDDSPAVLVERADAAMHDARQEGAGYREYSAPEEIIAPASRRSNSAQTRVRRRDSTP